MDDPIDALVEDMRKLESLDDLKNNKGKNYMNTGVIQDLQYKDGGNWYQCRFKIDGETYGIFCNKGDFDHLDIGDTISYDWVQKGKYRNIKDIKLEKKGTKEEKKVLVANNEFTNERIFYSGVQKPAVELVSCLLTNGLVTMPKSKADGLDAALSLVEEVTGRLASQVEAFAGKPAEDVNGDNDDLQE